MKAKYMMCAIIREQKILELIEDVRLSMAQKIEFQQFTPTMAPHITFVPPFFATYEDVKNICGTFNFLLSRVEDVIFSSGDLNWMNFEEDVLHIPIKTYPGFIINIEHLRTRVAENFEYVSKIPNGVFYPHITVAKGVSLKNLIAILKV